MRLTKAWTAIDRLSVLWKSELTDKIKRSFFQVVVVSILLYGCTPWTLTKHMEKKLDGNYTRMLRTVLNKSWRQRPTKQQLYGYLPPTTKAIKLDEPDMQDTAGEAIYSCGPPHMDEQRQDDLVEPIYTTSVPIQDIALKTSREWWTIGRGGESGSGRSVLAAWHHDDDDIHHKHKKLLVDL